MKKIHLIALCLTIPTSGILYYDLYFLLKHMLNKPWEYNIGLLITFSMGMWLIINPCLRWLKGNRILYDIEIIGAICIFIWSRLLIVIINQIIIEFTNTQPYNRSIGYIILFIVAMFATDVYYKRVRPLLDYEISWYDRYILYIINIYHIFQLFTIVLTQFIMLFLDYSY